MEETMMKKMKPHRYTLIQCKRTRPYYEGDIIANYHCIHTHTPVHKSNTNIYNNTQKRPTYRIDKHKYTNRAHRNKTHIQTKHTQTSAKITHSSRGWLNSQDLSLRSTHMGIKPR